MIANYLIGLREGLEAALVIGILAAYLVTTGRAASLRLLMAGVGAAIAASLALATTLTVTRGSLPGASQEVFSGLASIVAVALVTWMVFWMRAMSGGLRGELRGAAGRALASGGLALAVVGFLAVGREGLETTLFLWAAMQTAGSTTAPALGAVAGLATAALLGRLIYRGSLRLNIGAFFTLSGIALIVVAAGVLAYGVHDLQAGGLLPQAGGLAFDVSAAIPPDSWYGSLLKGTIGFTAATTRLQALTWLAYAPIVLWLYLRRPNVHRPAPHEQAHASGAQEHPVADEARLHA